MKDITRQVSTVLAMLAVVVVNALASILPINGQTTGEISDQFEVFFVPAGYVFSIWGVIYLALIAYSVYQALPSQRENPRFQSTGWLYVLSCVANIAWILLWHYEVFVATIFAMVALLLLLIAIYLRLGIGQTPTSTAEKWLARVPFSIYLGWITVATIANVTSLLDYLNWGGWGIAPEVWGMIMLIIGAVVALAVSLTRGDVAYVLVIVWAFAGIAIKHSGTPIVVVTAWVAAAVVALSLFLGVPRTQARLKTVVRPDRW